MNQLLQHHLFRLTHIIPQVADVREGGTHSIGKIHDASQTDAVKLNFHSEPTERCAHMDY